MDVRMKMSLTLENLLQTLGVACKHDLSLKFPYCSRRSDWTPKCRTELILGHGSICYFKFFFFWVFQHVTSHKFLSLCVQWNASIYFSVDCSLATSWLPPLQDTPPIFRIALLQAVSCWDGEFLVSSLCKLDDL